MAHFYKHNITDWRDGTASLTDRAYRVYHVIVEQIMLNEGPILYHDKTLAGLANRTVRDLRFGVDELIKLGKIILDDTNRIHNRRAETELQSVFKNRVNAGKGGASSKPEKGNLEGVSKASRNKVETNSRQSGAKLTSPVSLDDYKKTNKINDDLLATLTPREEKKREENKEEGVTPPLSTRVDEAAEAFAFYNTASEHTPWPKAMKLTDARKASLKRRLDEVGLEGWKGALRRAAKCGTLVGENGRGWVADLDFFLQPKSFQRLIEGFYDNRNPKGNGHGKPNPLNDAFEELRSRFDLGDDPPTEPA